MSNATKPQLSKAQSTEQTLKKNSVGFIGIAFFIIAAAAPMAAFVGAGPVLFSLMGPGVPLVYILVAAIIAIFAIGYLKMSKHITNAGGFVAYIARGLGAKFATGSAGVVIVTYLALQVGLWAQYGVFAQQLMAQLGLNLPIWLWILITLAVTTALAMRGIDVNLKVLGIIIALEVLIVAILVVGILLNSGGKDLSVVSFSPAQLGSPGLGVAILFVFACFTTFEATTVFAEEAKNPRRTIPLALYTVILFVATFYTVSTWAVSVGIGPDKVQEAATNDLSGVIFQLAMVSVGPWMDITMQVLVVTSFIAMLIGMQNMFARYCFALGRARILPQQLATVSKKNQSPAVAALVNGIAVGVILMAFLWGGADPIVVVYAWFLALGTAGFILIMTIASLGILVFFLREKLETGLWSTKIAPTAALILTIAVLYIAISNYDAMLFDQGSIAKWLLLLLPLGFIGGFALATFKKNINFEIVAISG